MTPKRESKRDFVMSTYIKIYLNLYDTNILIYVGRNEVLMYRLTFEGHRMPVLIRNFDLEGNALRPYF